MDKQNKQYLAILVITQLLIFLVMFGLIILLPNNITKYDEQILQESAFSDAMECMHERVNNLVIQIDLKRADAISQTDNWINSALAQLTDIKAIDTVLELLRTNEYGATVQAIVTLEKESLLYKNHPQTENPVTITQEKIEELHTQECLWKSKQIGNVQIILFAAQSDVDTIVKRQIRKQIYAAKYSENEYIWINELVNTEGGDNYAIRVVHPNLEETEGQYLSTLTQDVAGDYPYLKELQGISEKGEIFHTYFFKNRVNDKISEKLSYAKLYKPFNWIIATGKPLSDIFSYTDILTNYNKKVIHSTMLLSLVLIGGIFLLGIIITLRTQKKYRTYVDTYVEAETARDTLTGAMTRKLAQRVFNELEQLDGKSREELLFIMIDIDDFKAVNDTYGHDVGDLVLKKVTQTISSNIRAEDKFFRWGGEEFLLLCSGIPPEAQDLFADKLLWEVNNLVFKADGKTFQVSLSMGGCYGRANEDFADTIKKADRALYLAKNNGKNCYCTASEER